MAGARPIIKPPLSSSKEVALIKAEVENELKNKKQCTYKPFECTQLTLEGYNYCLKHILNEKSAPFKQCSYIHSTNGKRCHLAAPKIDKKEFAYCTEHALKTTLAKNRHSARFPPPKTAEVMLYSLKHYLKKSRSFSTSDDRNYNTDDEASEQKITKSLDPFSDIDPPSRNVLDFCSESDSDLEPSTIASVWPDAQNDSSDNESIDSEEEDPLKHANVYTEEEISTITRDKLVKLQSLYVEQYRYLQHVFKEKKRKYSHSLKREKETCCNIHDQIRENPKEQRLYKKLKALNKYHKTYGVEAIMEKRLHDSRITEGLPVKPPSFSKCIYMEGGVKCGERTLPLARHCRKHILEDQAQVLFKCCGKKKADVECITPVEVIFENVCCKLHMEIPPVKTYSHIRKNSESDMEDSYEAGENSVLEQDGPKMFEDMKEPPSMLFEESSMENTKPNIDETMEEDKYAKETALPANDAMEVAEDDKSSIIKSEKQDEEMPLDLNLSNDLKIEL